MAAAKIIVVEKNEGEKIAYDVSTTKIIFGDDDLMVNIKNRERDEEVTPIIQAYISSCRTVQVHAL